MNTINYKELYTALSKSNEMPCIMLEQSNDLKYEIRNFIVNLQEVFNQFSLKKIQPKMISICADVIQIPANFSATIKNFRIIIRARRIEVESGSNANIYMDFQNNNEYTSLIIFAKEVDGNINTIPIYDQGPGSPYKIKIEEKGISLSNKDGKFTKEQRSHLISTENFQILCTSVFQIACLFFNSQPYIAADQLKWLKEVASEIDELKSMCAQSSTLFNILTSNSADSTFVPILDKNLYKEELSGFLSAAESFENQYRRYKTRDLDIKDRKEAALLIMKHEQDTALFKERVIQQAKNNLESAKRAFEKSLSQFKEQEKNIDVLKISFETGLKKFEHDQQIKQIISIVTGVIEFTEAITTVIATEGAAAPAEMKKVANAVGTFASLTNIGTVVANLAKKLKECTEKISKLVELVKKVHDIAQSISQLNADLNLSKEMLDKIGNTNWNIPQEDLTGANDWEIFRLQKDLALKDCIEKEIDGAKEYNLALDILAIHGQTLISNQIALIRCNQEYTTLLFEKQVNQANTQRLKEYIYQIDSEEFENISMEQKLYQRYLDIKRTIFVAFENYKRAYKYWALRDSNVNPNPLKHISELKVDAALLQQDCIDALTQFNPSPQPFKKRIFEIKDPKTLQTLKDNGEASWRIPLNDPLFKNESRVRVKVLRIWLEGIENTSKVKIHITNPGHYLDSFGDKKFQFNTEPFKLTFSYKGSQIDIDGTTAEEFAYNYFIPTPFTTWTIKINDKIDLSKVTKIRMELSGSLVDNFS
ncbi:hypothetical protein ACEU2D_23475 [Brevibacillus laterosporus]|uniref:hypothetical protein n=1 Tax=Brevibacillus laterosporus TaxID=1465 RepID=UPI0035A5EE3A